MAEQAEATDEAVQAAPAAAPRLGRRHPRVTIRGPADPLEADRLRRALVHDVVALAADLHKTGQVA